MFVETLQTLKIFSALYSNECSRKTLTPVYTPQRDFPSRADCRLCHCRCARRNNGWRVRSHRTARRRRWRLWRCWRRNLLGHCFSVAELLFTLLALAEAAWRLGGPQVAVGRPVDDGAGAVEAAPCARRCMFPTSKISTPPIKSSSGGGGGHVLTL